LKSLALRHQLGVLQRSVKRPRRLFEIWTDWRLFIAKPQTEIAWHRKGFRPFWTWKTRRGKPGRPAVVRALIRGLGLDNSLWGAPRG
jgi:putative transposase